MINLTKHQFKICEAVTLGLTHYYMGPHDKREVTATERAEVLRIMEKIEKEIKNDDITEV